MTPEQLVVKAVAARARVESEGHLPTNDVDVALGWLSALAMLVEEGEISREAAERMRDMSASFAAEYCATRIKLKMEKDDE